MPIAFIGIGSNLGNRIENCVEGVEEISTFSKIIVVSSFYETEPVDKEDQPDFINCVAKLETSLSPFDLLTFLQSVENTIGREHMEKWGPRIIDLDIIFYDELVIETDELIIPHPRAHLRRFVLEPLSEIAPDIIHPVLKISVSKLLDELKCTKRVVKVGGFSIACSQKSTTYPQT
ncbi:MAG: 2-amino-4-hydroxy-6-hydroxymethyldihydropteridine pyrophosphokinase [Candidatus Dadabacteria bacterium CSP1-2]|nr:MAG: 2-amino-4-hydroxy-6-hydroxymethyldihydropteridine pyrophosphokinase [Candidatus Dadabacteria bacterium CSP1-2]